MPKSNAEFASKYQMKTNEVGGTKRECVGVVIGDELHLRRIPVWFQMIGTSIARYNVSDTKYRARSVLRAGVPDDGEFVLILGTGSFAKIGIERSVA